VVLGDLSDEAALKRLVDGADAVVHAAGLIKARQPADFMAVNRDGTALLSLWPPTRPSSCCHRWRRASRNCPPYGASKHAAEEVVAGRSGPWLTVRAPAVYGPGDRETLAYFRAVARGLAPRPRLPTPGSPDTCRRLAEALALAVEQPPAASTYEIDDGREGGHSYRDMAEAAGRAVDRRPLSLAVPRAVMTALAA